MAIDVQEEEVQSCPSGAGLGPRLCLAPSVAFSRAALGLNWALSVGLEGLPEAAEGPPSTPVLRWPGCRDAKPGAGPGPGSPCLAGGPGAALMGPLPGQTLLPPLLNGSNLTWPAN